MIVCNDRIIAVNVKGSTGKYFDSASLHASIGV
jgi:hypothetical protein